jgi:hypothetical protein
LAATTCAGTDFVGPDCVETDCVAADGDRLDAACTGVLGAAVGRFCWTVCVTGAALVCMGAVTCVGTEADGVRADGAGVVGRPARATPASAAKQTMTPATRIDRPRFLTRADTVFLLSKS